MLVPFHPSVARALSAVPAILPTMHQSPNVSLSGVIYCINIKQTKQCCQWANQRVKMCVCRGWAVQLLPGGESSSQHGCHRSVKLQSAELGLWQGADWFLAASVCVGDMHGHEHVHWMCCSITYEIWTCRRFLRECLIDRSSIHIMCCFCTITKPNILLDDGDTRVSSAYPNGSCNLSSLLHHYVTHTQLHIQ